jgi:hypothetical protein
MNTRKFLGLSLVVLSLTAATQAMALNPQPEPPNMPRISNTRLGQGPGGDHFHSQIHARQNLPPSPCRHVFADRCR